MKAFSPRALLWMAASAAAFGAVSPAYAQSVRWSKSEAILGGAPSALEAIIAQQQGAAAPTPVPVKSISYEPAPSSYPKVIPAILRSVPAPNPGVVSGNPDVFGSVALRVGSTRLDARWHRVDKAGLDGPAARFAQSLTSRGKLERLEAVNWYVNRRVTFVADERRWGQPDVGATARIMRSPSCRCFAGRAFRTAIFIS